MCGGVGGEDLVQPDDVEHSVDAVGDRCQGDVRLGGEGVIAGGDQDGDAAGVAEGDAGQVDDELLACLECQAGQERTYVGGAVVVEFSGQFDDGSGGVARVRTVSWVTAALHWWAGAR